MNRCLFLCFGLLHATQLGSIEPVPKNVPKQEKSLYEYYFWCKKFSYWTLLNLFIIDQAKLKQAVIHCQSCNYELRYSYAYGFFVGMMHEKLLYKLEKKILKSDSKSITQFMIQACNKYEITCLKCGQCCWDT